MNNDNLARATEQLKKDAELATMRRKAGLTPLPHPGFFVDHVFPWLLVVLLMAIWGFVEPISEWLARL